MSSTRSVCLLLLFLLPWLAQASEPELLIVLADSGKTQGAFPVFLRHPHPRPYLDALQRGYSGRLLLVYRAALRAAGRPVEPAYLCITRHQGGFPRRGFVLDGVSKPESLYVDLVGGMDLHGRFGAMDQIFPHELFHHIAALLCGEPKPGGSNQTHAIGVRTDPVTAFNEGIAEHCQILAIDDPDAHPFTKRLGSDGALRQRAFAQMEAYGRELSAPLPLCWRWRTTFPFWFGQAEQALRYWAVKDNLYSRESFVTDRLAARSDRYAAYLAENVLPGDAASPRKALPRLVATESVVAHYAWRVSTFWDLDTYHGKMLEVLRQRKPQTLREFSAAWRQVFPEDAGRLDSLEREALGAPLPAHSTEIWLANRDLTTGTTLFDQFRALPRTHTFDLNGATRNELMAVAGMDPALADNILRALPVGSLERLRDVRGMTAPVYARFQAMQAEAGKASADENLGNLLRPILLSLGRRFLLVWAVVAAAAALLYRLVRPVAWWHAALNGAVSMVLVLAPCWVLGLPWFVTACASIALLAVPAAVWSIVRPGKQGDWRLVLLAWAATTLPAALASWPYL